MTSIDPAQRFSRVHPCPVCGGHAAMPQHQGVRCYGFLSSDGEYAHCTREELAGPLPQEPEAGSYAHRLTGACRCGAEHGAGIEKPAANGGTESEKSSMPDSPLSYASGIEKRANARQPAPIDYHYVSADGELLATHRRSENGHGKRFAWLLPDGSLSKGQIKPAALPLYRLGDVLRADPSVPVFFTEGEKACEALRAVGLLATCLGGGAGQRDFGAAFVPLAGRTVIALPDNDTAGQAYMAHVGPAMGAAGANWRICELPDLPLHGDAADWLAGIEKRAGGPISESEIFSMLDACIRAASSIEKRPDLAAPLHPGIRLRWLPAFLAETSKAHAWLVQGLLLAGGSSVLAAKPKAGKSTTARALLAAVARGEPFLDRETVTGTAVYLAIEEDDDQLREQLRALGLSDERIALHTGAVDTRGMGAVEQLAAVIAETGATLAVIDPLYKFVRVKDGNDYTEVSAVLEPLTNLARSTGCHICIVHHATKGGEGQDSILGSTALAGAVDTLLHLKRDGAVRTLSSTQRYGTDLEAVVLAKDDAGRVGVSGTAFDQSVSEIEGRVMEAVYDGAFTDTQIVARVTGDTNLIRFALRKLVTEGFIERRGSGKRGSPFEYYPRQEGQ